MNCESFGRVRVSSYVVVLISSPYFSILALFFTYINKFRFIILRINLERLRFRIINSL
jgi:hypothetical protein